MMKKLLGWLGILLLVLCSVSFGPVCYAEALEKDELQDNELKKACLSATITAIQLEIDRHNLVYEMQPKPANTAPFATFLADLNTLQSDLNKYQAMDVKDYVLPEKITVPAWFSVKPGIDSILYVEGMSKSGPWFHLAGIVGGDYSNLQPEIKYDMSFYPVYPRSYWQMQSDYVCIAKAAVVPQVQGKKITGEVFERSPELFYSNIVKCENYKVYLLKDLASGSANILKLDAKQSAFDITLSEEELKNYSYIEFVSGFSNKTLKIDQIATGPQKVVLEAEMVLKKPAIYLYPVKKTEIVVTHAFKGKITTTYPAYKENWTIAADPNGNLFSKPEQRNYPYLFWEGVYAFPAEHYQYKSGFYVDKVNYTSFLQTKLAAIGLNEKEINDFIVYWLPAMNHYEKSFVYFRINDDIDGVSVLTTKPAADTTIRVFMEFAGIDAAQDSLTLPEQVLPTIAREGFTLVEWGGAEIGESEIK